MAFLVVAKPSLTCVLILSHQVMRYEATLKRTDRRLCEVHGTLSPSELKNCDIVTLFSRLAVVKVTFYLFKYMIIRIMDYIVCGILLKISTWQSSCWLPGILMPLWYYKWWKLLRSSPWKTTWNVTISSADEEISLSSQSVLCFFFFTIYVGSFCQVLIYL